MHSLLYRYSTVKFHDFVLKPLLVWLIADIENLLIDNAWIHDIEYLLIDDAGERRVQNSELWHACAGPLVSLPAEGTKVVYFPQGHSEHVSIVSEIHNPFLDQKSWDHNLLAWMNDSPRICHFTEASHSECVKTWWLFANNVQLLYWRRTMG